MQSCIDDFNVRINGHSMTVEIELLRQSKTELLVYSLYGILITTFVDNLEMEAGHYSYSSFMEMKGTYLVVLKSGGETKVKKILII